MGQQGQAEEGWELLLVPCGNKSRQAVQTG